jgi:hypothetical protein
MGPRALWPATTLSVRSHVMLVKMVIRSQAMFRLRLGIDRPYYGGSPDNRVCCGHGTPRSRWKPAKSLLSSKKTPPGDTSPGWENTVRAFEDES